MNKAEITDGQNPKPDQSTAEEIREFLTACIREDKSDAPVPNLPYPDYGIGNKK